LCSASPSVRNALVERLYEVNQEALKADW